MIFPKLGICQVHSTQSPNVILFTSKGDSEIYCPKSGSTYAFPEASAIRNGQHFTWKMMKLFIFFLKWRFFFLACQVGVSRFFVNISRLLLLPPPLLCALLSGPSRTWTEWRARQLLAQNCELQAVRLPPDLICWYISYLSAWSAWSACRVVAEASEEFRGLRWCFLGQGLWRRSVLGGGLCTVWSHVAKALQSQADIRLVQEPFHRKRCLIFLEAIPVTFWRSGGLLGCSVSYHFEG